MADAATVEGDLISGIKTEDVSDFPEESPLNDNPEARDSVSSAPATGVKDFKAWTEHETKTLIGLYKTYMVKYPDYSTKLLCDEVSEGLKDFDYHRSCDRVRNRLKTLKTGYRRVIDYNARHAVKKDYPYLEDLASLYETSPALSDDNSSSSGVAPPEEDMESNASYTIADDGEASRKLRFVRTKSPRSSQDSDFALPFKIKKVTTLSKGSVNSPRRNVAKKSFTPMFQCGLCLDKFSSSNEMHTHPCPGKLKVEKPSTSNAATTNGTPAPSRKRTSTASQNGKSTFQWNSMSTLQFLILLKDCKMKPKNSNIHRNLLEGLSGMMKKHGISVSPEDLEKKWKCLAGNYEKTTAYNKKHKDKKKCAFFNRLSELYKLGADLDMFKTEEHVKMTVEVSPFSYSSTETRKVNGKAPPQRNSHAEADKNSNGTGNNSTELVKWLSTFWGEWKELERRREAAEAQRHMELMEILSYVADGFSSK